MNAKIDSDINAITEEIDNAHRRYKSLHTAMQFYRDEDPDMYQTVENIYAECLGYHNTLVDLVRSLCKECRELQSSGEARQEVIEENRLLKEDIADFIRDTFMQRGITRAMAERPIPTLFEITGDKEA